MTTIDLYCGMFGVGKTTLIRHLLTHGYETVKCAIIENEVGAVNLDAALLEDTGVTVTEMTSGCICCTIRGQLAQAVREITEQFAPDVIIMEPSGAADVRGILEELAALKDTVSPGRCVMIAPAKKIRSLLRVVGDFYKDQIRCASTFFLNRIDEAKPEVIGETKKELLAINPSISFVDKPLSEITLADFPAEGWKDLGGPASGAAADTAGPALGNASDAPSAAGSFELRDLAQPKKITFGAGKSGRLSGPGAKEQKKDIVYTWKWDLPETLSEKKLEKILAALQDREHMDLWRVKGLVHLEDGSTRKIDLVFGDLSDVPYEGEEPLGGSFLQLIGKKIDRDYLEELFD